MEDEGAAVIRCLWRTRFLTRRRAWLELSRRFAAGDCAGVDGRRAGTIEAMTEIERRGSGPLGHLRCTIGAYKHLRRCHGMALPATRKGTVTCGWSGATELEWGSARRTTSPSIQWIATPPGSSLCTSVQSNPT